MSENSQLQSTADDVPPGVSFEEDEAECNEEEDGEAPPTSVEEEAVRAAEATEASDTGKGRYRNWCWTLNNPTPEEIEAISSVDLESVSYTVYQHELSKGREVSGIIENTPHLQGYSEFKKQLTMGQVKNRSRLQPISPRIP